MTPDESQDIIKRRARQRSQDKPYKPFVTEKQLSELVRKASTLTGWRYYHTWMSIRSAAGFPDVILIHPARHRLIVLELKTETGKVTPAQQEWLDAWRSVPGASVYVLRPSGFDDFFEELKR